jgi:hypothetical protein
MRSELLAAFMGAHFDRLRHTAAAAGRTVSHFKPPSINIRR